MYALFSLGADIHKTKAMHERRLCEINQPHLLLNPYSIHDQIELMVALNLLEAAKRFLERYVQIIQWRSNYLKWPQWQQEFLSRWLGLRIPQHADLERRGMEMRGFIQEVKEAIEHGNDHMKFLDSDQETAAEIGRSLSPGSSHRRGALRSRGLARAVSSVVRTDNERATSQVHWWATWQKWRRKRALKALKKHRTQQAASASLPRAVQRKLQRRNTLHGTLDGTKIAAFSYEVPFALQPAVKALKGVCFDTYTNEADETQGTTDRSIHEMERQKSRATVIGGAYLVLTTLYIFLAAIRIEDNKTVRLILLTTFVSEGVSIGFMQPLELLIISGFLPAIAVLLFWKDVELHVHRQNEVGMALQRIERIEAQSNDISSPFERSGEWSRIEGHEAFGSKRMKGVSSMLLMEQLQEYGILVLEDLQNPLRISREVLSDSMGLSDTQVDVFWSIVHPSADPPGTGGRLATSRWNILNLLKMGRRADETHNTRSPKNTIVPVLPALNEQGNAKERIPSDHAAHRALSAFKRLKETAPLGEVEASRGVDNRSSEGLVDEEIKQGGIRDPTLLPESSQEDGCNVAVDLPTEQRLDQQLTDDNARRMVQEALRVKSTVAADEDAVPDIAEPVARQPRSEEGPLRSIRNSNTVPLEVPSKMTEPQTLEHRSATEDYKQESEDPIPEEEPAEEVDMSIEQWLNTLGSTWGDRYSSIFNERGHWSVNDLHLLSGEALRDLQAAMSASDMERLTRHRIRAAIRAARGDIEQAEPSASAELDGEMSTKQWLDSVKRGYGAKFGSIFEDIDCLKVSELHLVGNKGLAVLQASLASSIPDKKARRRIRSALRSHLDEVAKVTEPASDEEVAQQAEDATISFLNMLDARE